MSDGTAPNHKDQQGRKAGHWSEADSHGGITSGEYVDGERHGLWRHQFVDGSLRSEGSTTTVCFMASGRGTALPVACSSVAVSFRMRSMAAGTTGRPMEHHSTPQSGTEVRNSGRNPK